MANPFVNTTETYERTIIDARDGTEWHVTYRPLTTGDRAVLQDLARMTVSDDEAEGAGSAEMRLGRAQIMTLDRAIVTWDLPLTKTRTTIESLHPEIFDSMFEHIAWGHIPEDAELEAETTGDPLPSSNGSPDATGEQPTEDESSSDRPETSPEAS